MKKVTNNTVCYSRMANMSLIATLFHEFHQILGVRARLLFCNPSHFVSLLTGHDHNHFLPIVLVTKASPANFLGSWTNLSRYSSTWNGVVMSMSTSPRVPPACLHGGIEQNSCHSEPRGEVLTCSKLSTFWKKAPNQSHSV